MAKSWLERVMTSPKDGVNPAVGDDDPQIVEADFLSSQSHNRLTSRALPVHRVHDYPSQEHPHHDTTDHSGAALAVAVGLEWDGQNRRGRGHDNGQRLRHSDVIRFHRSLDAREGTLNSVDGLVYIVIGSPTLDKIWEMRTVILTYNDPWTTGPVNSQAAIFAGQPATGPKISDLILMGIAIPASVTWSHDQQVIQGGQTLYVAINNPGANPGLFQASADVCEYDLVSYRKRRI